MVGRKADLRLSCWLVLLLSPSIIAEEAQDWLARMTEAAREQSFHGAFVYERTGSFTTHYIWRRAEDGNAVERLVQTDGQPQEWLRQQGGLVCSSSRNAQNGWHGASGPVDETGELDRWYSIQTLGETRVAARPVSVVALFPRDAHRYAHEFYIDDESGLLLKSLLISDRQTLLERFQFATFELVSPSDESLRPSEDCRQVASSPSEEFVQADSLEPSWLPPGFAISHQDAWRVEEGDARVLTQAYSDGLARFTLFIEPLTELQLAEDLRAQLGPTVAVSRRLVLPQGNYLATVVGEIPAATAERIVGSFHPEQAEGRP